MMYVHTVKGLRQFFLSGIGFFLMFMMVLLGMTRLASAEPSVAGPKVSAQQVLDPLVTLLEDPEKREALIKKLKNAAEGQVPEEAAGVTKYVHGLLNVITAKSIAVTDQALQLVPKIQEVPVHLRVFVQSFTLERVISLVGVLILLGLSLMVGFLFDKGARILVEPLRAKSYPGKAESIIGKHLLLMAHGVVTLIPIGVFYLTGLTFVHMASKILILEGAASLFQGFEGKVNLAIHILFGIAIYRALMGIARVVLAPQMQENRYFQCSDACAQRLFSFLRGWLGFIIIAFSVGSVATILGLDVEVAAVWSRVVGFVAACMLVRLVLVEREAVANWLRSEWESNEARSKTVREILVFTADIWHFFAIFIIAWFYVAWALGSDEIEALLIHRVVMTMLIVGLLRIAHHVVVRIIHIIARVPWGGNQNGTSPLPHLDALGHSAIYVMGFLALLHVWGLDLMVFLKSEFGTFALNRIFAALGVAAISILLWEMIDQVMRDSLKVKDINGEKVGPSVRTKTLIPVLRNIVKWSISGISVIVILGEFGVNIGAILAGLSVLGLAVAMGSKRLAEDVLTGFFIMMENSIDIGDVVTIAGVSGEVKSFSLRTIVIRNISGELHTIPYGIVSTVSNFSKEYTNCLMEIAVGHEAEVSQVVSAFEAVGAEMMADKNWSPKVTSKLRVIGVSKMTDTSISIMSIMQTDPDPYHLVDQEFRHRILTKLRDMGVPVPAVRQLISFSGKGKGADLKVAIQS